MLKIRLKRLGRKKRPFFRIVVMDVRERRQGASLDELGFYNPLSRELKLDKQAAAAWIGKGALPTSVVGKLIEKAPETGELVILEKAKKERLSKKAQERQKKETEAAASKAQQEEQPAESEAAAASGS